MNFNIMTLFPEMFDSYKNTSIIGRAKNSGLCQINCIQIRDFAFTKHRQIDDYPYGGGQGMIMQAEPVFQAYQSVAKDLPYKPHTIYLSPQGKTFRQSTARRLQKKYNHIILICGHYEGVDQRLIDEIVDEEISLGDFVLTGGELAAAAVVDAVLRLVPGVLKSEEAFTEESHTGGLLEFPQYTRPEIWHEKKVPDVLLSGHHKNICLWKRQEAIRNTFNKRKSMLSKAKLSKSEAMFLNELRKGDLNE